MDDEALHKIGWYKLEYDVPEYDSTTHTLELSGKPVYNKDRDVYVQNYNIVELPEEIKQRNIKELLRQPFEELREERNKRIAETDYLVMTDYPISEVELAEVKTYRQALRDLPAQEGAPWVNGQIPWPDKPSFLNEV